MFGRLSFFCVFLFSFNSLAKLQMKKKGIPVEHLPATIVEDLESGTMNYIRNQQCFVTSHRTFYDKNLSMNHVDINAACVGVNPDKKINWDHPAIPANAQIKKIHVVGKDLSEEVHSNLKRGKTVVLVEKLAYYNRSHKNYRENEYLFPIIAGLMIIIFAQEKGILSNLLNKIYYLGLLSYSIYLLHPIYIGIFRYFNMKLNIYLIIIYLICIMLGSFLFYKNIEKFIIKWKYDVKNKC